MKKLLTLFLMLAVIQLTYGQKASIIISHTVTYDSISVLPDSILITNITQGGDTTLYGSDTTLVLDYTTSLFDHQKGGSSPVILPNYPNPFKSLTHFDVVITESGDVAVKVYDITGKEISGLSGNYLSGSHKFSFKTSKTGLFVIQVTFKSKTSSIKAQSLGGFSESDNEISYLGIESTAYNNKSIAAINGFAYTFGNQLKSVVYYQSMSDTTDFIPTQDTVITIHFQNPSLCPATFTDARDNNVYTAVLIGTQCWMAENLAYLPSVSPSNLGSDTTSFYYVYDYQGTDVNAAKATSNYQTYGVLYNWPAAMAGQASSDSVPSGVQGVCPAGWHLPSDSEWTVLTDHLGGESVAGGKMKEAGTTHWSSPNTGATNSSGFTALPGGYRLHGGSFDHMGVYAGFWSSTELNSNSAWYRYLVYYYANVSRYGNYKEYGFSVRCCKD